MLIILTTGVYLSLLWSSYNGYLAEATGVGGEFDEMGEMQQSIVCYDYWCFGGNCLYGNLTAGGAGVQNCTTNGGCYVDKTFTEFGVSIKARCGIACDATSQETNGTTEKTITDVMETRSTPADEPFPKRRRRREVRNGVCCSDDFCNHDSPCGKLTCDDFSEMNALVCYDVNCTGEGCLYDAITEAGSAVTTCTAAENSVCYIAKEQTADGLSVTAGCGPYCRTPTSPDPTEPTTTTEPKTGGFMPRRRRSSTNARDIQCCSTDRCNHDSPCGTLDCVTEAPLLVCYETQCEGEGCLYADIIKAGSAATTCTATGDQVCYVKEDRSSAGISYTAGCGLDCEISTVTSPTTKNANRIPPYRRRKRSLDDVSNRKCCKTSYCNHNSPCGSLTCGAEILAFEAYSPALMLALFALIYQF